MQIDTGKIKLEVEDFPADRADAPVVLLIMGLGMQLLAWPLALVELLRAQGFRVIRFDNRDIGLSQSFDHLGEPAMLWPVVQHALRLPVTAPYTVSEMAQDCVALLDALNIKSVHVCGASMGGMIAQHLAAEHADRVASLTLMMTTSGNRRLPQARPSVQRALLSRPRSLLEDDVVARSVQLFRKIGSPAYPAAASDLDARIRAGVRRSYRPAGMMRQLLAVAADGDRSEMLNQIKAPTVVVHGQADPLVPVAAAHDLASKIAGARLELIEGMGHDLPPALLPRFADAIALAGC
jgi:pimeloyl-ACP methyl ester carboxylesterase